MHSEGIHARLDATNCMQVAEEGAQESIGEVEEEELIKTLALFTCFGCCAADWLVKR